MRDSGTSVQRKVKWLYIYALLHSYPITPHDRKKCEEQSRPNEAKDGSFFVPQSVCLQNGIKDVNIGVALSLQRCFEDAKLQQAQKWYIGLIML